MVLNQVRARIQPVVNSIGKNLGRVGVTPNMLTAAGFAVAVLAGLFFAVRPTQTYLAGLAIIISGIFDVLDGAVARATNMISTIGSLNDSTLDRVAEISLYGGIIYAGYSISPVLVLLTLGFSLLVSYVRAKGESLGVTLSGIGIGERAERLIVLVIFALVGYVWIGIYIILALVVITFGQRYLYVAKAIRGKKNGQEKL